MRAEMEIVAFFPFYLTSVWTIWEDFPELFSGWCFILQWNLSDNMKCKTIVKSYVEKNLYRTGGNQCAIIVQIILEYPSHVRRDIRPERKAAHAKVRPAPKFFWHPLTRGSLTLHQCHCHQKILYHTIPEGVFHMYALALDN